MAAPLLWLMAQKNLTTRQKIAAVMRLEHGETLKQVSGDLGISRKQLAQWRDIILEKRPDKFPNLAGAASDDVMAEQAAVEMDSLKEKTKTAADMVLDKFMELLPLEHRMDKVAIAYGILVDKLQIMQGKPTSITGEAFVVDEDATPAQLESQIQELRERRERESSQVPKEAT